MSYGTHPGVGNRTRAVKEVSGRFKPNGASALDTTTAGNVLGRGFTVTRSGAGQYTVTTDKPYGSCIDASATLWSSTIIGGLFRVRSVTLNAKNVVVVFEHLAETTGTLAVADIAAAADNFVSFTIRFSDAKVQRA